MATKLTLVFRLALDLIRIVLSICVKRGPLVRPVCLAERSKFQLDSWMFQFELKIELKKGSSD